MGLQIRRRWSSKFKHIATAVAVFALVAQPIYGLVASRTVSAVTTSAKPTVELATGTKSYFKSSDKIAIIAKDNESLKKVVGNVYTSTGTLVLPTQSPTNGASTYIHEVNLSSLANGKYSMKYNALDTEDNMSTTHTLNFTIDNAKPWAELKNSSTGNITQKILQKADIGLRDNAKIVAYTINGVRVQVSSNTTKWGDANDIKVGSMNGIYGVNTLVVEDAAGNVSDPFTFVLDNVAPKATVNDRSVGMGTTFSKVFYDLFDTYKIDKVTINDVEKDLSDNKYSNVDGIIPGKFGAREGENTLVVYDVAGNTKEYVFTLDTQAPTVESLTHSNDNDNKLVNTDVISTLHVSEPIQTPAGWSLVDGSNYQEFTKVSAVNNKGEVAIVDFAGNSATFFFEVKRIDKTSPEIGGVANGDTRDSNLTNFTITDQNLSPDSITVDGVGVICTALPLTYTWTCPGIRGEGSHSIVATDKAGNKSTVTFAISTPPLSGGDNGLLLPGSTVNGVPPFTQISPVSASLNVQSSLSVTSNSQRAFGAVQVPQALTDRDSQRVLGVQDVEDTPEAGADTAVLAATSQGWKLMGLAWYWWLAVVAALAGAWWLIAALRRRRTTAAEVQDLPNRRL